MPTYQYSCTSCGHFHEVFQNFSDSSLTVCPECEGRLRKVFNAVGVVFKGSGFYRNDSRSQPASAEAGASSNGAAKEGAATGAADSTPAKKSEGTSAKSEKSAGSASTTPSPA